jgi:hypothetical protein
MRNLGDTAGKTRQQQVIQGPEQPAALHEYDNGLALLL